MSGVSTAMCWTVDAASDLPLPTTSISFGSFWYSRATDLTQGGCVAEKRTVWRRSPSVDWRMVSTSSLKPMLSISSASSSTANCTSDRSKAPSFRWSMMRPGVPTSRSTPSRSALCCGGYGTPPWKRTVRSWCTPASISHTSPTCRASSRVGASTTIRGLRPRGSRAPGSFWAARAWIRGSAKARVLPVPVRERASMSEPALSRL
mmetsp:Transcript_1365/g.4362  ORF Transcript_1365/g.4362 Transcript_1365/m.4362 type:complete len:205 (+) Transcript_1365:1184-1798(+)